MPELEAKNANGFTALHIAANAGYVEIVKMFMEVKDTYGLEGKWLSFPTFEWRNFNSFFFTAEMDLNIRDNFGFSAAYWAKEHKHK